jgi:VIT1/CCC1 family predicted Fe2+/Mn2+ transporter
MKKFDCPSCLQPTFSLWQKMTLGPARKIICSNCGAAVSVPWLKSTLVIILFSFFPPIGAIAPFFFVSHHESIISLFITMLVGAILGIVLLSWLYSRWVPLVEKKQA